jgi:hypothetical protein
VAAERDAWLADHGEATLALMRAEQEMLAHDRDALREDLMTRARDRPVMELAERDAWAKDALAEMQCACSAGAQRRLDLGP